MTMLYRTPGPFERMTPPADRPPTPSNRLPRPLETTSRAVTQVCLFARTDFRGTYMVTVRATGCYVDEFMAAMCESFNLSEHAGTFTIAQSHTAWSGFGATRFAQLLSTEYDHRGLGGGHHREGGVWTASTGDFHPDVRRVIVTAVHRTDASVVEVLQARFLVDGVPVTGAFSDALEALPGMVRFARNWEREDSELHIARPGDHTRGSRPTAGDATAAASRLIDALDADAAEHVETPDGRREFWIENPYYENAAALRTDFQFDDVVTYDTVELARETPGRAVEMDRDLYKLIPALQHLRIHITGGSAPDSYSVKRFRLHRLRPAPSDKLTLMNVNAVVKGQYAD